METWILTTKESRAKHRDYPLGTKAHAVGGGCWIKVERGWKWATNGCVVPTPGADVIRIELPENKVEL